MSEDVCERCGRPLTCEWHPVAGECPNESRVLPGGYWPPPSAFVDLSGLGDVFKHDHDAPIADWDRNRVAFRVEVPRAMTDAERAEHAARQAERDARRAAFVAALTAAGGLVAALVDLHKPDEQGDCAHESDDESFTFWPCETVRLAAEHAGVPIPDIYP